MSLFLLRLHNPLYSTIIFYQNKNTYKIYNYHNHTAYGFSEKYFFHINFPIHAYFKKRDKENAVKLYLGSMFSTRSISISPSTLANLNP